MNTGGIVFMGTGQPPFQWLRVAIHCRYPVGDLWAHGTIASLELTHSFSTLTL